jgi:hypothetical protein
MPSSPAFQIGASAARATQAPTLTRSEPTHTALQRPVKVTETLCNQFDYPALWSCFNSRTVLLHISYQTSWDKY